MHIAEGVLSPAQCAVWYAAAAPVSYTHLTLPTKA